MIYPKCPHFDMQRFANSSAVKDWLNELVKEYTNVVVINQLIDAEGYIYTTIVREAIVGE